MPYNPRYHYLNLRYTENKLKEEKFILMINNYKIRLCRNNLMKEL